MKKLLIILPLVVLLITPNEACRNDPAAVQKILDGIGYPECALLTPADGDTVGSYVLLQATATDDLGIVKVEFIVDDEVIATDLFAPYKHEWLTDDLAQFSRHSVYAAAYDTDQLRKGSVLAFVTINHDYGPPAPVVLKNIQPQVDIPALLVTWTQSAAGDFQKYVLRRQTFPGVTETSPVAAEITNQSVTFYQDDSIDYGQEYFYRVFVVDTDGYSSGSDELSGLVMVLPGECNFGNLTIVESAANPVLDNDVVGSLGVLIKPTVVYKDGTYHMWMTSYYLDEKYQIGYATSLDGENWTGCPENPVIKTGPPGAFDADRAGRSAAMWDEDDGLFKLWYGGRKDGIGTIGYAESPDGIHWTKYADNPVMLPMELPWEGLGLSPRTVIKRAGEYIMWYSTRLPDAAQINSGYAVSPDGIHWVKRPTPVFTGGSAPFDPCMVAIDCVRIAPNGNYEMLFSGWNKQELAIGIGRAVSADGLHWITDPSNPLLVPTGGPEWNGEGVMTGWFIRTGNDYRIWYSGDKFDWGSWTIGTATGVMVCD